MSKVRLVLESPNLDAHGVLISKNHRTIEIKSEALEYLLADKPSSWDRSYKVVGGEVVDAKGASQRAEENINKMAQDF